MKSIIISIIQILFLVSPVSASERETDYIVTFYPESGSILQNISCKIVFTAEGIDKKKISITGVIINERGDTVQSVKTLLRNRLLSYLCKSRRKIYLKMRKSR